MPAGTEKKLRRNMKRGSAKKTATRNAHGTRDEADIDRCAEAAGDVGTQVYESFIANSGPLLSEEELGPRVAIYMIQRIASMIHKQARKIALQYDLHVTDVYVLLLLHRSQPRCVAPAADLQKALLFTSGGMTRRLDRLSELGLLKRIPNPKDRRSWLVRLTPAGKEIAEDIRRCNQPQFNESNTKLSKAEWHTLTDLLQPILRTVVDEGAYLPNMIDKSTNDVNNILRGVPRRKSGAEQIR